MQPKLADTWVCLKIVLSVCLGMEARGQSLQPLADILRSSDGPVSPSPLLGTPPSPLLAVCIVLIRI